MQSKKIMDEVTDSIDKNEVVKLPDNFKPPTILSGDEIKKENKKEQEDFIDTSLIFNSEEFKTAKSIDEEEKNKLFKIIVDPNEGLLVDDQINIDDWNPLDNSTDPSTTLPKNMKNIVDDIIMKTIDDDIQEIITVTLRDPQNYDDNEFRPITLDSNNDDITPDKRLTPIYIEDNYVVQDPQNIEMKINLKRKNEPSENRVEMKK